MIKNKIHVVMIQNGEYSEATHIPIKAFYDKEKAISYCDEVTKEIHILYQIDSDPTLNPKIENHPNLKIINKLDIDWGYCANAYLNEDIDIENEDNDEKEDADADMEGIARLRELIHDVIDGNSSHEVFIALTFVLSDLFDQASDEPLEDYAERVKLLLIRINQEGD